MLHHRAAPVAVAVMLLGETGIGYFRGMKRVNYDTQSNVKKIVWRATLASLAGDIYNTCFGLTFDGPYIRNNEE